MDANILTHSRIKQILSYEPDTGIFRWQIQLKRCRIGVQAGSLNTDGYLRISVDGKRVQAHRLAWFYVYGVWPSSIIDHINGVKTDNRISNLRESNATLNSQNQRKAQSRSKVGLLGVSFRKECTNRPYMAHIRVDGKGIYVGCAKTAEEASLLYIEAKRKLHKACAI